MRANIDRQLEVFGSGSVDLVSEADLRAKLAQKKSLRIKLGCDPSAPNLHLGHVVQLDKLRALQELGHTIVFLVGDFTAMIGDPTGRSKTRPPLTRSEVRENAETYVEQVDYVLDRERREVSFNSEWMDDLSSADFVRLASHQPVARMLERDDFKQRFQNGATIAIHEFLYPLVQAYDSVALEADLELGGTDQLFNLLLGREIQRAYGQAPQVVLTLPLLEGVDGSEKMSKSLGNAIGIREPAEEIYGKTMSIPDEVLPHWIELLAGEAWVESPTDANPRDRKAALARHLVERFHGPDAAIHAEAHFDQVFRQRRAPDEIPEKRLGAGSVLDALVQVGFAASRSEARRLVGQGGVRLDGERVDTAEREIPPGVYILQVGKRRFARLQVRS